jgi:hypothetical protein
MPLRGYESEPLYMPVSRYPLNDPVIIKIKACLLKRQPRKKELKNDRK